MPNPPLNITLYNHFGGRTLYAYLTATELKSGKVFLLQADGRTLYFPPSPSSQQPIQANCNIPVSSGGTQLSVPTNFAGGRLWFCLDTTLTFAVNPGPGLVEPSSVNPSDPNAQKTWDFCELTFDYGQLFANITYVDFVCMPIALKLVNKSNAVQQITGFPSGGLGTIANQLTAQNNADGAGWNQLIVRNGSGAVLRILSPGNAISVNNNLFANYWTNYVNQVYSHFTSQPLTINTQSQFGNVNGQVSNGQVQSDGSVTNGSTMYFPNGITMSKPNATDIFGCNSGPFRPGQSAEAETIVPRFSAAFNRSTLLESNQQPNGVGVAQYYPNNTTTNYYSKIVHANNTDKKGYAFPYDDVAPDGGPDVSGAVFDPNPQTLFVTIGGGTNGAPA